MGLNFSFATASQILFGNHSLEKVPGLVSKMGNKILLVTGKNTERAEVLIKLLPTEMEITGFKIESEPSTVMIEQGAKIARENNCEMVVGFGGGSVIDGAKAIAALASNEGELMDYLEVIGKGKALERAPLPSIAIPTTSGTGAEVTKNSVIKSLEHNVKVSLRSDLMYPNVAVVDPVLTYSLSPKLTASTGVDALTHLLETFVSNQSNPFIDMICREGLYRISRSLVKAYKNGNDEQARTDMAMASMWGGMALANVKLGAVHGFAGPMGGMFSIPHGEICACLMAAVIQINIEVLTEQGQNIEKFTELAKILTGSDLAKAEDAIVWADNLIGELKIPSLSQFGLTENDFPELIQKAKVSSSMKGNPVELNDEQLRWILDKSF
ncbi:iron-containing alcohol dehydrogenase [Prolixibacteraceae bacterium Z1-6]|uniref:Iron-containing alcohol dehydrogenase n=1 Tax=Draconibacterium aestuarii TaxID=2998507 RepID=A0A9X3F5L7_9BACT|nr:iron-containing alcohol dehydrogenase [Prolixibacteraceae bacterium Z1-6]